MRVTVEARQRKTSLSSEHPCAERHLWQIAFLRDGFFILLALAALWAVYSLRGIFLPIFAALVLAYVCDPAVSFMQSKWHWPRLLTTTIIIVSVLLALVGFFSWLGPLLFEQFMLLARKLPDYVKTLAGRYNVDIGDLAERMQSWMTLLRSEPQQLLGHLFSSTGRAVGILAFLLGAATHWVLSILLVLLYFFFFSWRLPLGLQKLSAYIPETRKARVFAILGKMDRAFGEFFRGRLLVALLVGVLLSAGWYATGVPYWFFLGIVTGLLNIVPYLALVSWPIALVLKYVDTLMNGAGQAAGVMNIVVWPSVVYVVIQFFEGWVLTPWIQSGKTELSAVTIILVVFIGEAVAGIWGMLFAIPVAACVKILAKEMFLPRLKIWALMH